MKFLIQAIINLANGENVAEYYNELPTNNYNFFFDPEITETTCLFDCKENAQQKLNSILVELDNNSNVKYSVKYSVVEYNSNEDTSDIIEINCECGCKQGEFDDFEDGFYIFKCKKCGELHFIKENYFD